MKVTNLIDLLKLTQDDKVVVAYLQFKNLVKSCVQCMYCKKKCSMYKLRDSFQFYCERSECRGFTQSLHSEKSLFSKTKLSYSQVLFIFYSFVHSFSVTKCSFSFSVSKATVVEWYSFCQDICINACIKSKKKIGGKGKLVEVTGGKLECKKIENLDIVNSQWAFGGVEKETKRYFLVPVQIWDLKTLALVIEENILPGTAIVSDCYKASSQLHQDKLKQYFVNHSITFKNTSIRAAVQKRFHFDMNHTATSSSVRNKDLNIGCLAEDMWRSLKKEEERFEAFIKEVASIFSEENDKLNMKDEYFFSEDKILPIKEEVKDDHGIYCQAGLIEGVQGCDVKEEPFESAQVKEGSFSDFKPSTEEGNTEELFEDVSVKEEVECHDVMSSIETNAWESDSADVGGRGSSSQVTTIVWSKCVADDSRF